MEAQSPIRCSLCETGGRPGDPFCPECGKPSPQIAREGAVAVELPEIPSENIRKRLVDSLRQWFPDTDRFRADDGLRKGPSILIAGIDEESGARLLDALKPMNVDGRLRPDIRESGISLLWNAGLGVSAGCIIISYLLGGLLGLLFLLGALAAPAVGAAVRRKRNVPIVSLGNLLSDGDKWRRLSRNYSAAVRNLAPDDAASLRSLTEKVFDLQSRLRSGSLASVAAGGEGGGLYRRLREALETAVDLSGRITSSQSENEKSVRMEFASLASIVTKTAEWYAAVEAGEIKQTPQLNEELQDIAGSIERIMEDVRPSLGPGRLADKKIPL